MRCLVRGVSLGTLSQRSALLGGYVRTCTSTPAGPAGGRAGISPMPYKSSHKGKGGAMQGLTQAGGTAVDGSSRESQPNLASTRSFCAEDGGSVPSRPLSPLQRRQLMMKYKAAFQLTPQAIRRVKYLLQQHQNERKVEGPAPDGIRVSVRRRGCSGYSYTVNYNYPHAQKSKTAADKGEASEENDFKCAASTSALEAGVGGISGDVVVVQDGVKVVVDSNALFYVIGTEMDYVVRNVEEKFTFRNPNQKYSCGCEESFMPFDADDQL
uniref:FeS cluster biogenesis domain-containing protein n=1 Tax=Trypanosoma congolense (strain IL3000) TaxID=1068625 RepID=G0USF0_TRYCI|nr:conserved hypothetical protein [Trypanosoma congolense IL3000]